MCYSFLVSILYFEFNNLVLFLLIENTNIETLILCVVDDQGSTNFTSRGLFRKLLLLLVSLPYDLFPSTEFNNSFLLGCAFELHPWMANYIWHAKSILRIDMKHESNELLKLLRKRNHYIFLVILPKLIGSSLAEVSIPFVSITSNSEGSLCCHYVEQYHPSCEEINNAWLIAVGCSYLFLIIRKNVIYQL